MHLGCMGVLQLQEEVVTHGQCQHVSAVWSDSGGGSKAMCCLHYVCLVRWVWYCKQKVRLLQAVVQGTSHLLHKRVSRQVDFVCLLSGLLRPAQCVASFAVHRVGETALYNTYILMCRCSLLFVAMGAASF